MFLNNFIGTRRVAVILFVCILSILLSLQALHSVSAQAGKAELEQQINLLKDEIERPNSSSNLIKRYNVLTNLLNDCNATRTFEKTAFSALAAPTASLCISGASLSVSDPTFNRPVTASQGSGFGPLPPGSCTPSTNSNQQAVRYDAYTFNLTGCSAFPTAVTATLCGPAGCSAPNALDTTLFIYRDVASGDPLTGNGGLPSAFNPTAPCTNAGAAQDDLATGAATTTGGSSCNQLNTSDCLAACTGMTGLSGLKRSLGSGQFTVVVAGFSGAIQGNYNLYVDAPGAGCAIAQAVPTAASVNIEGRVLTSSGRGISNTTLELSGGALNEPIRVRTNSFGYYRFIDIPAGDTYIITISSKRYTFANPSQVVNLSGEVTNADFISHQ